MLRKPALTAAMLLLGTPVVLARPAAQQIGSWTLRCPETGACTLQHRSWILPPAAGTGPSAAVEVQRRRDALVPVVAVRGLSPEAAFSSVLALKPVVTLRFDAGAPLPLGCDLAGAAILCAPEGKAIAPAATALPAAHTLTVQIVFTLPGAGALPEQDRTLELAGTVQALAAYRTAGASGETLPAEPGLNWREFLDRVLKTAGIPNGLAGLLAQIARTMNIN